MSEIQSMRAIQCTIAGLKIERATRWGIQITYRAMGELWPPASQKRVETSCNHKNQILPTACMSLGVDSSTWELPHESTAQLTSWFHSTFETLNRRLIQNLLGTWPLETEIIVYVIYGSKFVVISYTAIEMNVCVCICLCMYISLLIHILLGKSDHIFTQPYKISLARGL